MDTVIWGLSGGGPTLTATNIPLVITIPIEMMPVVTTLNTGFTLEIDNSAGAVITGISDANLKAVEVATDPADPTTGTPFTGSLTTTTYPTTTAGSSMKIVGNTDGVGTKNAQYQFNLKTTLPLPQETVVEITVPSGVVVPSASSLTTVCNAGCKSSGTLTWTASSSTISIANMFLNTYLAKGTTIQFTITGWTNPGDTSTRSFIVFHKYKSGSTLYNIEKFTGFSMSATEGICNVQSVTIPDGDVRIYAQPKAYRFRLWCSHALTSQHGLRIVFPSTFALVDRASCQFGG